MRRSAHLAPEAERELESAVFHGRRDPRGWSDRVRDGAFVETASQPA